jgi:hypothetical protein
MDHATDELFRQLQLSPELIFEGYGIAREWINDELESA